MVLRCHLHLGGEEIGDLVFRLTWELVSPSRKRCILEIAKGMKREAESSQSPAMLRIGIAKSGLVRWSSSFACSAQNSFATGHRYYIAASV